MTTPTPTDSDHGSTVATPDRKRQHAAPSQPDLAAKSRRRNGRQERAVRPRRRRPRRGDLDSREAGATIIEVRWEGASANTAHATPRRQGRRRNPARTPLRSSLRTETNEAPHSPQRWVGKRDRSVANSETPHCPRQHRLEIPISALSQTAATAQPLLHKEPGELPSSQATTYCQRLEGKDDSSNTSTSVRRW